MKWYLYVPALAMAFALSSSVAEASFKLRLSNDGTSITLTDEGIGDMASGITGKLSHVGAVGDYEFTITITDSKPVIGSTTLPEMGITVNAFYGGDFNSNGSADPNLVIESTDTDFGPSPNPLPAILFANSASGNTGSVTYSAFVDLGNAEFAQTTQVGSMLNGIGVFDESVSGSAPSDAAYSVTLVTTLTSSRVDQNNQYDVSLASVPEPGALAAWAGLILFGAGVALRGRLKHQA